MKLEKVNKKTAKRSVSLILAFILCFVSVSCLGVSAFAASLFEDGLTRAAAPAEGVTVVEDATSPTGYSVTFVYKSESATAVRLAGDLLLRDFADPLNPVNRYEPETWTTGRYHVGGAEFLRDMTNIGDGLWSVTIPMHAGGLSYWYRVDDPSQGWANKRIWDPASKNPRPAGDTTFRVSNNDVLDAVYVPYDAAKQNDPVLESRAAYELPIADASKKGSVQYVEYTNVLGADGWYLGVYLPAGYDANRAEPYKVMYLAHGQFGDETDWMVPGNAPNILDNMIAKGETEPMVIVTMGNHFTPSATPGGLPSYDRDNASKNIAEVILPFIEENFNVSDEREGRAFGGFSAGGATGGVVLREYHDLFGYFGFFSGNPSGIDYNMLAEESGENVPFIFMGRGYFEGNLDAANAIRDSFRAVGIPSETGSVNGAHDMMTAGMLFTDFAKEYLWKSNNGVKSVRALTDMGWWGQRVTGVVLEFGDEVDASKLSIEDFAIRDTAFNPYFDSGSVDDPSFMRDQTVVDVFTVADPELLLDNARPAASGKYVVVMVEPNFNGGTKISVSGGMMANPNQPTEITIGADIYAENGDLLTKASADPLKLTGAAVVNRGVDKFVHGIVENPAVGVPLNYSYRLPDNYDPMKKYPLVVYFNGNGQGYYAAADNIGGQLICDGTPVFWFNEMDVPVAEDVIFLAPQNTRSGQSAAVQAEQSAELIENFSKEFSVDTSRVYGYSLSAGSGLGWWLLANRPDLFAGFIHTGFMNNNKAQADAIAAAEPPTPIRLFQGRYDHLMGSAGAIASYQRIVDAYKANGYTDEEIEELIQITLFEDEDYDPQGPGLHTPSGPQAGLIPNLPGPRIDRHAPMVPAFQNPATSQWLLAQVKPAAVALTAGATVVADENSPTGYSVTFVYKNENATKVSLAGDLLLRDLADPLNPVSRYEPETWATGRYHVGGAEFLRNMTNVGDGYWTVTIPMHAGGLSYWYRVDDPSQEWVNKRLYDPASTNPRPAGDSTYRVNNNDVLDAVYVPYDAAKQNDPILESRAAYELPVSDPAAKGTVEYVEYTNVLGDGGGYLGVYLPAGFDLNREERYKVVYLAHGMFGDETDWMVPGNGPNILDNMIARGEIEPTVIVTMGNHFTPATRPGGMPGYNGDNTARNLVEVILPLMEERYNVANVREGRAYAGFSMGGMTGSGVLTNYHNLFGYYGFFSGNPNVGDYAALAEASDGAEPFVMLGRGAFEGNLDAVNAIRDNLRNVGIPSETYLVNGAHDMMTAGMLFTEFAKEYLWKPIGKAATTTTLSFAVTPDQNENVKAIVTVEAADESAVSGQISVTVGAWSDNAAVAADGAATLLIPRSAFSGLTKVTAAYAGTSRLAASEASNMVSANGGYTIVYGADEKSVSAKVYNLRNTAVTAMLIVAGYDETGRLANTAETEVAVAANDFAEFSLDMESSHEVKAFVWEKGTYSPMGDALSVAAE